MKLMCPISIGEFIDKVTILEIKSRNITDVPESVFKELNELYKLHPTIIDKYHEEFWKLFEINRELWRLIAVQYHKLSDRMPDVVFADVSKRIIILNKLRSEIKQQLNKDSDLQEVKYFV